MIWQRMNIFLLKKSIPFCLFIIATLNIAFANGAFAQASFSVDCPQKTIGKNDYLQIAFKLSNASNVESINPPSFKNFIVVSGPNQESGMTSINGKTDQYVSVSYVLRPTSTGILTIGEAIAKADGKKFTTKTISVNVTKASTSPGNNAASNNYSPFPNLSFDLSPQPSTQRFDDYILKKGENINDKVKKNLFIKLDVSKTSCYVGEPITASYKLYSRLRSESNVTNAPTFNGFSVSDLPLNNTNSEGIEKYNGRDYNFYVLRKVQLYPLQAGTFTLDPIIADNKITFLKADYAKSQQGDMLFDMMQNFADATSPQDAVVEQNVTLQSKPVTITVKPLPEENKPIDFKGAVGNFTIESSLQKDNITTDDAGNLKITIAGSGNIQLINAPKISWPEGIDGYAAKIQDAVDKSAVPMKGAKAFIYPFTASSKGDYIIPSVSFSFFDPATSTYKSIESNAVLVHVSKGKGVPSNGYLKKQVAENQSTPGGIFEKYFIYFVGGIILIAAILFWTFKKNMPSEQKVVAIKKGASVESLVLQQTSPQPVVHEDTLEAAYKEMMQENGPAFYNVLDTSIKKYLSARLHVPAQELTKKRLNEELDKCNVSLGTSLKLSSLLEDIELNVYAPPSNINHLKETYEKASEVISLLDKQVC